MVDVEIGGECCAIQIDLIGRRNRGDPDASRQQAKTIREAPPGGLAVAGGVGVRRFGHAPGGTEPFSSAESWRGVELIASRAQRRLAGQRFAHSS